jgi:hypothetical protein
VTTDSAENKAVKCLGVPEHIKSTIGGIKCKGAESYTNKDDAVKIQTGNLS